MLASWYRRPRAPLSAPTRPDRRRTSRFRPRVEALEDRCLLSAPALLDINAGTLGSNPSPVVEFHGLGFFSADDGVHGRELWKTDGTEKGTVLVKVVNPGSAFSSSLSNLTVVHDTLFFTADDGTHGIELWKSDGTEKGTVRVKDVFPGSLHSFLTAPQSLTAWNDTLFFTADDRVHGRQLWESDGTDAGTFMVKAITSGSAGSDPQDLTAGKGALFFTAVTPGVGRELWESDGTEAGTVMVKDINPTINGAFGYPTFGSRLTNVNGTIFFAADDGVHGKQLWKSDGTEQGTVRITSVNFSLIPIYPVAVNDTLFFTADDYVHGRQLWKSDGTAEGTGIVKVINPGPPGSPGGLSLYYSSLTNVNGTVFFTADDGTHGRQLWKSDGTDAGTMMVKAITSGGRSAFPGISGSLTNVNGTLFFAADDGTHGEQLWESDGTEEGTVLVKNIAPRNSVWPPSNLSAVGGALFFSADDGFHGNELWTSDGTDKGTHLVKDINLAPASSNPQDLTDVNGTLFFTATDGLHGRELWKTTLTANGPVTTLVTDINPGPDSSNPRYLTAFHGEVFFSAYDGAHTGLWKSDGTKEGTVLVKDITPYLAFYGPSGTSPQRMTVVNDTLYLVATDHVHGYQVWKSDGTAEGTVLLKDLHQDTTDNPGLAPYNLTAVGSTLFFTATDNYYLRGYQLWKSDGTEAGTVMVKYISYSARPEVLTDIGGTLYFTTGGGLWKSDGTEAGTVLVKPGLVPARMIDVNGTLFITGGGGLWKSDGTTAGTVLLKGGLFEPYAFYDSSVARDGLVALNGTVFFAAGYPGQGLQLWKSDGTPEGTVPVEDFFVGSTTRPQNLTVVGDKLFFTATDGLGTGLWESDGTADGTVLVFRSSALTPPAYLTNVNGNLFFAAGDGTHGNGLWGLLAPAAPPAVEEVVVNDGSVQRSQVTSLTVSFSTEVSLDEGALEVRRQDGSLVPISLATSVVGGKTVVVITFTGPGLSAGSLPDGHYTLTVHHDLIHDGAGQALVEDASLAFFRLYGDVDGDGDLDDQDLQAVGPKVSSVRLNEGDSSGAQVHSITIHFNGLVTLAPGAFELVQQGGGPVGLVVTTSVVDGKTVAVLTFTGDLLIDGALPDGAYTLTVHGGLIHDGQGLALGGAFAGDNAADFFGAGGSDQPDLVGLFHPA
jgi:ELWxxDGT repeat protein